MQRAEQPHAELAEGPSFATDDPGETLNSTRIGHYMAEADILAEAGWDVQMRYDEVAGTLAAVITPPPSKNIHTFRAPITYTIFRPIPPGSIAAYGMGRACAVARYSGDPVRWEKPMQMVDILWLAFWMGWREHYQGDMPHGWPLSKAQAS